MGFYIYFFRKNLMQNQNLLELDMQDSNYKSPGFSPTSSPEIAKTSAVRSSKYIEKNEKIYSENDSKKFESILLLHIEKMKEKTKTRNQLLTQHKQTLLHLFKLGATIDDVLTFLQENNFSGITADNLKEFLKKSK